MSTSIPAMAKISSPPSVYAAAVEMLAYLTALTGAALAYVVGWLTPNGAAALTAVLLVSLIVLGWARFNQGRHPCFLFLCMLLLLQGGRLLTYCLGSEPDPMRVRLQTPYPFDLSRDDAGIVLLCVALSAICIYLPCRWNYRPIAPPSDIKVRQYLPYLYLLFYGSLPVQIYKNYSYYQSVLQHGGYASFFISHAEIAASVPLFVRIISLATLPAFVAIFVFEKRKRFLYPATFCYFGSSILILLLGTRMATFGLIVTLWYVVGVKSGKKSRLVAVIALAFVLLLAADVFQSLREDSSNFSAYAFAPVKFVTLQGNSLDVSEVMVKYRGIFSPYIGPYMWRELQNGFLPHDYQHYFRGRELGHDVSVLLNPAAFSQGYATSGSYLAEEYMIGGVAGVVLISLAIGAGLHFLHRLSQNAFSLFFVVMLLPDIIGMPRGDLLDWLSVLFRTLLFLVILGLGWLLFDAMIWLRGVPRGGDLLPAGEVAAR